MAATKKVQQGRIRDGEPAHERWPFCSDHLPIGVQVVFPSNQEARVISWNALNTVFMRYIYKDEQGLNGSAITTEDHKATPSDSLTIREFKAVGIIQEIFKSGASVLCLQEISPVILKKIRGWDGNKFGVLAYPPGPTLGVDNHCVTVYDITKLQLVNWNGTLYPEKKTNSILDATFELLDDPKSILRVLGTHVPFGSDGLGYYATYLRDAVRNYSGTEAALVALGDCNCGSTSVGRQLADIEHVKSLPPPYKTHINARMQVVDYDNAVVGLLNGCQANFAAVRERDIAQNQTFLAAVDLLGPQ